MGSSYTNKNYPLYDTFIHVITVFARSEAAATKCFILLAKEATIRETILFERFNSPTGTSKFYHLVASEVLVHLHKLGLYDEKVTNKLLLPSYM